MADRRPSPAVSLPAGIRSRIVAGVTVVAIGCAVFAAQVVAPWSGDRAQLTILAVANLLGALGAWWYFLVRGRARGAAADRRLAAVFLLISVPFILQLAAEPLPLDRNLLLRAERISWVATQLIAAAWLAFAASEPTGTPGRSRELRRALSVVCVGLGVAAVGAGLRQIELGAGLSAQEAGLAAAFLVAAWSALGSPRQRWLESSLGASGLLLALGHAVAAVTAPGVDGWSLWTLALIPIASLVPVLGAARDDIDRMASLTTLSDRIRSQRLRTEVFLDTLPVLVLSVDRNHRLRYANLIAGDLLAIPRGASEPSLAPVWLARVHPPDRDRLHAAIPLIADGGATGWEAVLRVVDGDGGVHWLNTQLHPVTDPETGETLVEVVASDVTDLFLARRTAEARQTRMTFLSNVAQTVAGEVADLRILERFLELGQEIYPVVSLLLYRPLPDGSRLRLEAASGPAVAAFERDRTQPVGPGHPCGLTYRDGFPRSAAVGETLPEQGARQIAADHGVSHVLYLPLLAAGRVVGVLATTTTSEPALGGEEIDLLTQVGFLLGGAIYLSQLVRELDEQRAVAMEASRLKSEFLANTSHELRTPLTAVLGFLRLVIDGAVAEPEKQREFLKIAHESAEKLLTIINDVLDLAKIEAGRLEVQHAPVPVRRIVDDVRRLFQHQMKGRGLAFEIRAAEDNLVLWADPDRTVQILTNLLSNAMKFTPRGGSIALDCRAAGGEVAFTVSDTGTGIPAEELGKVFESFYQVDGSTTRQHGGTGLGLTISRRLAELMGGSLTLDSPGPNQGTTATLRVAEYRPEVAQSTVI